MPRNMSFWMTRPQIIARTKTVTRRFGWDFLEPGALIWAVEKGMGLRKGEKIKRLALLRIVSIRQERLCDITKSDVVKEGFPDWSVDRFVMLLVDHYKVTPLAPINRIEFEYLSEM